MAEIRELSLVDVYMFSKHLREEGKPAKETDHTVKGQSVVWI